MSNDRTHDDPRDRDFLDFRDDHSGDGDLPDHDEQRLASLVRSLDRDAPPADARTLAAIRQRIVSAVWPDAPRSEVSPPETPRPAPPPDVSPRQVSHDGPRREKRGHPEPPAVFGTTNQLGAHEAASLSTARSSASGRWSFVSRGLGLLTAIAAAVLLWIAVGPSRSSASATPFSKVLDELYQARSLQLRVTRDGQSADVWVRAPGLVRREESPNRYQIAAGSRWWRIDEDENAAVEGDSPWFTSPKQPVDLLTLLDAGIQDVEPLLSSRAVERTRRDGIDCLVYRVALPGQQGQLEIEALVEAKSLRLIELVAWPAGANRQAGPPLAELRLVAVNTPIEDDKFVVAKSLTDDGRIGKVSDAWGLVLLRPMVETRWTPVCRVLLLKPGDWVRTEFRGANAAKITLASGVQLTLGPASLMECISPREARLHQGSAQILVPKGEDEKNQAAFTLLAPREGHREFKSGDKSLVRVTREEKLADVADTPLWLAGIEGTSSQESLGSLIVQLPDGRNEPLTVGYHKVQVEIRDQIARTTIEESFVNHTPGRLEGVFHFPLPQDASISGFGMWIGNELVEADVVEKQRAREIYETILREKRDPGLLEWTGGNIFKARVFPIEPRSEKRIKIVYTQLLPLRANRYRYSYGLRSELLRTRPLRELAIDVTVNSAIPLKQVTCPTHAVRAQQTEHSARLEFTAQEYSPDRDFEVVCETDSRQSDVVVVPHRRGDDGYFLAQITLPGPEGNWQRELLPGGSPLNVVLLCDTSGSMDSEKRKQQVDFVAAVLASLGKEDRFQLLACDVNPVWASREPLAPTEENIAASRKFLDERISLGWTNLDRAFEDVAKRAAAGSHVVYVGDGIVSAGEADPAAFVKRLAGILAGPGKDEGSGKKKEESGRGGESSGLESQATAATFHAVTVGNEYESMVLGAIATIGRGSMRAIGGEQTPQRVALELLGEISRPGLRNAQVEFRGLKVAAVYPERLPNLAAGTQQILVGRYLPEGKDQQGEIVVTGQLDTEPVRYAARIQLKDAEAGNSFIPRLWARAHLDHLLAQGKSQAIQDDVIRLSEEFHIITPYTSLLVLESDADRERFGVQRRYEMRDAERFFAAGRDNVRFELRHAQMRRASDWRLGLRRQVLRGLSTLGRDPRVFQEMPRMAGRGGGVLLDTLGDFVLSDGASFQGGGTEDYGFLQGRTSAAAPAIFLGLSPIASDSRRDADDDVGGLPELASVENWDDKAKKAKGGFDAIGPSGDPAAWFHETDKELGRFITGVAEPLGRLSQLERAGDWDFKSNLSAALPAKAGFLSKSRYGRRQDETARILAIFPDLERRPSAPKPPRELPDWSPEAVALANSLLRAESLGRLEGGLELRRVTETFEPRWSRRASRQADVVLYSPRAWLARPQNVAADNVINYCDGDERAVFSPSSLLGQSRAAVALDRSRFPLALSDGSLIPLHFESPRAKASLENLGGNQVKLVVTSLDGSHAQQFTIDTARHLLLKRESFQDSKLSATTRYEDPVEIGGSWWARKVISVDEKGRTLSETTFEIDEHARDVFSARLTAELVDRPRVQFVRLPHVPLPRARQRVADGSAGFDDRFTMIVDAASRQQWDAMFQHVDATERLAPDRPGLRWMRTVLLEIARRNEEARQRLLADARALVDDEPQDKRQPTRRLPDELFHAETLLNHASTVASWSEQLEMVELLKPVFQRQPPESEAMLSWQQRRAQCLESLNRPEQSLAIWRELAESNPWHVHWHEQVARRLVAAGQPEEALAWWRRELARDIERPDYEDEMIRTAIGEVLRGQGRWTDWLAFTTQWVATNPESLSHQCAYSQHLSALVHIDRLDDANSLAEQWLREARVAGKMAPDQHARLEAAIRFASGNAYALSIQYASPRWHEPLADTIRFFLRHPHHSEIATRGIGNSQLHNSDTADRLRGEFLDLLRSDLANLKPVEINAMLGWTLSGRLTLREPIDGRRQLDASEVPSRVWRPIADELARRREQTEQPDDKHLLGESLRTILANRFPNELLPFLRKRVADAKATERNPRTAQYLAELFESLLNAAWSDESEREAFQFVRQLSANVEEPAAREMAQVATLHRLVDAMLASREAAARQAREDQGGQEQLTRQELATKRMEERKQARLGLAARLTEEVEGETGVLAPWLRLERAWLDVLLTQGSDERKSDDQGLAGAEQICWALLGDSPPQANAEVEEAEDADAASAAARRELLRAALQQRALTTVMYLAARKGAAPATVERVLRYVDAGITQGGDDATRWRTARFTLLVALDRADDLERELGAWIRDDVSTAPWRHTLARLVAERGRLDEAIKLLEACEKDKLLAASDHQLLADWYLATDRRDAHERSRLESFKQLPEGNLAQMLYLARNRWSQRDGPMPSQVDDETVLAFRAVFEKSANPEQYLHLLREIHAASHDFRLLQVLPDAVRGRSPQQIYVYLTGLQTQILQDLRNEATADEILARVTELQRAELTGTDARALDLLEAVVERKSSEVLNQPGPHVEAAVAAMRRAFERSWGDGEPRMMASFLRQLGTLRDPRLVEEQSREMRALRQLAPAGSRDRLVITSDYCNLIAHAYGKADEAIREMELDVRAYAQANGGAWPHEDNEILGSYVALLEYATRHAAGEAILKKWLTQPVHDEQRKWLVGRLIGLYNHALEHDGAVSLGSGRAELFPKLALHLHGELDKANDETTRDQRVHDLARMLDIAHRHKLPGTANAVREFAFETMPAVLARQANQYHSTVHAPSQVVYDVLGPKGSLRYLVERMEQYPQRLEMSWQSSSQTFGYQLAQRREEIAGAGVDWQELEPRVLALAIRALKQELRSGEGRSPHMTHRYNGHFWQAKAGEFAQAAEEVLAELPDSGRRAHRVATYFTQGLDQRPRACEILLVAHRKGLLDQSARYQLVVWLHEEQRFAESIPLLEELTAATPDSMDYRVKLLLAYFRSQRPQQVAELMAAVERHFHEGGRWTEANIAVLAGGCLACRDGDRAARYFSEAIALHQRASDGVTLNDASLSGYYQQLSEAHSMLGQTRPAVDAAAAAIVCWHFRHEHRAAVFASLDRALGAAADLDRFVVEWDGEAKKTGQDSPLVRGAIGRTYKARRQHAQAISQFELALTLQPNDRATLEALIECHDANGQSPAATQDLLKLIDLERREIRHYQRLAERLAGNEAEAERAATSILEAAPNEAENHAALAELRQRQNRWDEAIPHWEKVAQLRRLEPTGLLKQAEARIHQKQWPEARTALEQLRRTDWPSRFQSVTQQLRQLEQQIP